MTGISHSEAWKKARDNMKKAGITVPPKYVIPVSQYQNVPKIRYIRMGEVTSSLMSAILSVYEKVLDIRHETVMATVVDVLIPDLNERLVAAGHDPVVVDHEALFAEWEDSKVNDQYRRGRSFRGGTPGFIARYNIDNQGRPLALLTEDQVTAKGNKPGWKGNPLGRKVKDGDV